MKKSISDYRALARMTMKGHYGVLLLAVIIQIFIQSAVSQIFTALVSGQQSAIMIGIYCLLEIMVSLIILAPINIGLNGFFIKAILGDYDVKNIFHPFKHNLSNVIRVNFLMQLKLFLWYLIPWIIGMAAVVGITMALAGNWLDNIITQLGTAASNMDNFVSGNADIPQNLGVFAAVYLLLLVISIIFMLPGIIKNFEYAMIPYILGEDENISSKDAFKQTKDMMKGNKFRYIGLMLSFIGWMFLGLMAFGVGMIFVMPYVNMAAAHFYIDAKGRLDKQSGDNFYINDEGSSFGI